MESIIKNYKLDDKIILPGSIPDASKYLPAFDIFVLPSTKEGFPYTLLEAMAAGLPIVATNVGAVPEILENKKTGLIVPPADSFTLKKAITQMIDNSENARRLGNNAKEKLKQFDWRSTLEKTKTIYLS